MIRPFWWQWCNKIVEIGIYRDLFSKWIIWDSRAVELEDRSIDSLNLFIFHAFNVGSLNIYLSAREIDFNGVQSFKSHTEVNTISQLDALALHLWNNLFWFIYIADILLGLYWAIHLYHEECLMNCNIKCMKNCKRIKWRKIPGLFKFTTYVLCHRETEREISLSLCLSLSVTIRSVSLFSFYKMPSSKATCVHMCTTVHDVEPAWRGD